MGFWIFMLACDLLIPVTMIGFGAYFQKGGPNEINGAFGYRTKRSMKNKETWEFAHRCCGRLWKTAGWVMLALSAIAMALLLGRDIGTVGIWGGILCAVQCVALILSIFPVEAALKKKFDEFGLPKERPNQ